MLFLFNRIALIQFDQVLLYGMFIFISIFAYTSLMDGSVNGIIFEGIRLTFGYILIFANDYSWFGIESVFESGTVLISIYLGLSLILSLYFYYQDRPIPIELMEYGMGQKN